MAVFTSPSAAFACAVAMQQAVELDNRRSDRLLGLRIGLSGGEVNAEDGDYFGDPVVEAARLCAICTGGQILTSDTVRIMAGRRTPHRFTSLGDRTLKGLAEPVSVCEVEWDPLSTSSGAPLPERLQPPSGAGLFGFVGRQREKEHLLDAMKEVAEGGRRLIFVSGEPGIGKTSLCRQVAQEAYERGLTVLYGRSDEDLGVQLPTLRRGVEPTDRPRRRVTAHRSCGRPRGALASLVPALSKRMPDVVEVPTADPDTERLRLFSAVAGLLSSAAAEGGGLLVVLDDLHWADRASLQLLRHLANSDQLAKVMLLGTYRDQTSPPAARWSTPSPASAATSRWSGSIWSDSTTSPPSR